MIDRIPFTPKKMGYGRPLLKSDKISAVLAQPTLSMLIVNNITLLMYIIDADIDVLIENTVVVLQA
jgi:hypothetical protein